jgi:iron complex transport system permease protein
MIVLATLSLLAMASLLCASLVGSVALSGRDLLQAVPDLLSGNATTLASTLLELRLGRALSGFATGATLATAGVVMQALLRNPLAEPYVLGISGGASVGALAAIMLAGAAWMVDAAAFGGALAVAALLFGLAYRDLRGSGSAEANAPLLLLTGVIVASGCGALVSLMLSIAPDGRLRGMVFWLIGDLSAAQPRLVPWLLLAVVLVYLLKQARAINVAAMHADHAATLGIKIGRLRQGMFLCAALLTASAVSGAGSIGFVGMIMPHA